MPDRPAIHGACTVYFKTIQHTRHQHTVDRWLWLASIGLLVALGCYHGVLAIWRSPSPDDAMFLSVPKNWVNGYGWATSYSEKIPFNPDFTGPAALLIPAAALIKLFGNQLWIAGVTGAIINFSLLTLCIWYIRHCWSNAALAALLLLCGVAASFPEDFSSLVGYYTGSLLFLLACLIAFNEHYRDNTRALLLGLLAAVGLLVKLLMAPAFCILALAFLLTQKKRLVLFCLILLPIMLLAGSWQWYKHWTLSQYSPAFRVAYDAYGRDFFLYHGSGIGQWQDAADKWLYVSRNADKNLYFLEEGLARFGVRNPFLGNEPADVHHIFGLIFIVATVLLAVYSTWQAFKNPAAIKNSSTITNRITAVIAITIMAYVSWFLLLAMAMSPGHLYFPLQWALWLFMLQCARLAPARNTAVKILLAGCAIGFACTFLPTNYPLQAISEPLQTTAEQHKAASFIQATSFPAPLAGCGYTGYPRHLEYLLPGSQNFSDCLDMIEDHVEQHEGHYRWTSPLAFTLVFSLQSAGINTASGMVMEKCARHSLYRNDEVFIFYCPFEDLQKIDLDALMPEITKTHNWYKTRIKP